MARREKLLRYRLRPWVFEKTYLARLFLQSSYSLSLFFFPSTSIHRTIVERFWNREFPLLLRLRGCTATDFHAQVHETWTRTSSSYCTPLGDDCGPTNSRSNWWNRGEPLVVPSPTLAWPPRTVIVRPFGGSSSSFPLGGNPVDRSASQVVLLGVAFGKKEGIRKRRGWWYYTRFAYWHTRLDSKTCRRDFFLMATTFLDKSF